MRLIIFLFLVFNVCTSQLIIPMAAKRAVISSGGVQSDTVIFMGGAYGVAKTTDFGATWTLKINGMATNRAIVAVDRIGTTLLAASSNGGTGDGGLVYRSTDNGENWTAGATVASALVINCMATMGDWIFVGTENNGVYISTDLGVSWTQRSTGLTGTYAPKMRTLIKYGTTLYGGTGGAGVYKSTNYGVNWTQIASKSTGSIMALEEDSCNGKFWLGDYSLGVGVITDPANAYTFMGKPSGLTYAIEINNSGIFSGSYTYGSFKYTSGTTWAAKNTGLTSYALFARAYLTVAHRMFLGTLYGPYVSYNAGAQWNEPPSNVSGWAFQTSSFYMQTPYTPVVRDFFNRADGALGANWTNLRAGYYPPKWKIVSNSASSDFSLGTGYAMAMWNTGAFNDNQYSKIVCTSLRSSDLIGVAVRLSSYPYGLRDACGYYVCGSSVYGVDFGKIVNGTITSFANTSPLWVAGDVVVIRVVGSTVSFTVNGVVYGSVTDTQLTTGRPGLGGRVSYDYPLMDNWEGGNIIQ